MTGLRSRKGLYSGSGQENAASQSSMLLPSWTQIHTPPLIVTAETGFILCMSSLPVCTTVLGPFYPLDNCLQLGIYVQAVRSLSC